MPVYEGIETFGAAFARLEAGLDGERDSWIHGLRRHGFARFEALGFPTTRDEDFRHTSVEPIRTTPYERAPEGAVVRPEQFSHFAAYPVAGPRLVFVDGRFSPSLSSVEGAADGVRVVSLKEALETEPDRLGAYLGRYADVERSAFAALNTAFLEDGAFVHIARLREAAEPVTLLYLQTDHGRPTSTYPRTLVVAEEGSAGSVVEVFAGVGEGAYLTDSVTEIVVGQGASLDHVRVQRESPRAHHVANMSVVQGTGSRFTSHAVSMGAALARNDIGLRFDGPDAEGTLNGLMIAGGRQHMDTHTVIDHAHPHCNSRQTYRGILDGSAHGVFAGRIMVRPDAQKTDAQQNSRNLLLSKEATANALPQLEIFADDVRCTHGATVGALDEDAIYYLRARGIPEVAARGLLTHAFAGVVLETIPVAPLRERLEENLLARFTGLGAER